MTDEEITIHKKKLEEIGLKLFDRRYIWLRQLILLASGSLSVLISLRKDPSFNWYFTLSLTLLGLGILTCAIALYGEIVLLRKSYRIAEETISKLVDGSKTSMPSKVFASPFYVYCEIICYLSLLLAVPFLIIYAISPH